MDEKAHISFLLLHLEKTWAEKTTFEGFYMKFEIVSVTAFYLKCID
jgi:hypothetical protein